MTTCGNDSGFGDMSCCATLAVPGGTFYRTYDLTDAGLGAAPVDSGPTRKADPATVATVWLDKYLVTVGRFRQFVTAWNSGYVPANGSGKHTQANDGMGLMYSSIQYEFGWEPNWNIPSYYAPTTANLECLPVPGDTQYAWWTWTPEAGAQENLPINCATWYEAYAFCIWDGGFLPSEAEWGYAASGGTEQRPYPWADGGSDTPDSTRAVYSCNYPPGSNCFQGVPPIAPVGYAKGGAARWGQLDMAGELFEWTLDEYSPAYPTYADACVNCVDLLSSIDHVVRGGEFESTPEALVASVRASEPLNTRTPRVGFRCARTPQ